MDGTWLLTTPWPFWPLLISTSGKSKWWWKTLNLKVIWFYPPYIPSIFMDHICECKQLSWSVCKLILAQTLPPGHKYPISYNQDLPLHNNLPHPPLKGLLYDQLHLQPKLYIPSTINIWKKLLTKAIWADKKWAGFWKIGL